VADGFEVRDPTPKLGHLYFSLTYRWPRAVPQWTCPSPAASGALRCSGLPMKLRPYQEECLRRLRTRYREGARRLSRAHTKSTFTQATFDALARHLPIASLEIVLAGPAGSEKHFAAAASAQEAGAGWPSAFCSRCGRLTAPRAALAAGG
jgi:hypothetical protein